MNVTSSIAREQTYRVVAAASYPGFQRTTILTFVHRVD